MNAAVAAFQEAVDATPTDHTERAGRLAQLGDSLATRFERTGDVADLDAAIGVEQDAVDATLNDHPDRAMYLSNLGFSLSTRFNRVGDVADLDAAIRVVQEAVDATPTDHPRRAARLSNLGSFLRTRFDQTGDVADLDAAIRVVQDAVDATPTDHRRRAVRLAHVGASLNARFDRAGDVADLDAAIRFGQDAVDATPTDHPDRASRLSSLGIALRTRFNRAGDVADLDAASRILQEAVDATPTDDHSGRTARLSALGIALRTRFDRAGDVADLDAAIRILQEAVDATPTDDHSGRTARLSLLGASLGARFVRAGDVADLDAAIRVGQDLLDATPTDHPDRAMRQLRSGILLRKRFDQTRDVADLDGAIRFGQDAVDATPTDHPDRAVRLSHLSISLCDRFDRVGDVADLDAAIRIGQDAVDATSTDDQLGRAGKLSSLGSALRTRFNRAGDVADLDAAIRVEQDAVDATPTEHPDRAARLTSLGIALRNRFDRSGDVADLDAAVRVGQDAVDATPTDDHSGRAVCLSNLGNSLHARFNRTEDVADLDAAIRAGQDAVDATPTDHPDRAGRLSNLGIPLTTRFNRTGDVADLDAAIRAGQDAVDTTPTDHPRRAGRLSNLADSLTARSERTGTPRDLDAAIFCWRRASAVETGTPSTRLGAARRWGELAADAKRWSDAAEAFAVAVGLLPAVAWHGLDRATREEQLARWAGLASDAAACAVLAGRPGLAVELLEQGRSVLWAQALNLRTNLTRLTTAAPDLAKRLNAIRDVLATPVPDTAPTPLEPADEPGEGGTGRHQKEFDRRRGLAREWDEILARVRELDGFEHFLAPTPYSELTAAAVDGPVVVVNTSRYGCHALIVDADTRQPRVVDLPDLTLDIAVDHKNSLLRALTDAEVADQAMAARLARESARHVVLDVLGWLWDAITEPVLNALGLTSPPSPSEPWPQVWWCPTGVLNMLPIHAAGHHPRTGNPSIPGTSDREVLSVLDRVVSSYTPTLAALVRAREPGTSGPVPQLTVAMPTTPDLDSLPAATEELGILARHFPPGDMKAQLVGSDATRAAVLDAIGTHPWVHLACHARQNQDDPTRSGFALWDGPLTIADLAAESGAQRGLAFLSACQTASGSVRHLDEAIHLAAAMQFLGYRHVIATMWAIADSSAPQVADDVYAALTADGTPDTCHAAIALHQAIHALRTQDPTNPILWASYTHFGS